MDYRKNKNSTNIDKYVNKFFKCYQNFPKTFHREKLPNFSIYKKRQLNYNWINLLINPKEEKGK